MSKEKILVTCALPYANGPLHAGHIRSTYLPADIYVRYLKMNGEDVAFICGSDEHGTPITVRAERDKVRPIDIATMYHSMMQREFSGMRIDFDIFSRTTTPTNYKNAQEFFTTAQKKGYIYEKEIEQYFCKTDNKFLPDRYVEGNCPNCNAEGARGDHCEKCGRALKELSNPHCIICNNPPEMRMTKHWFFKLTSFDKQLKKFLKRKEMPPNVKNYAMDWVGKLQDWCITRDLEWGVPVPVKGAEGKVLYVWWDAPIGYVSATEEFTPRHWKEYWTKGKIINFIGKDIIYHHALFWPAMVMAHGQYSLPYKIVAGEYLSLEGKKMSTSRNWVVWVSEFLKKYPADYLRYYLTITTPLNADMDFSWKDFEARINNELSDVLGNFIHRTLTFTQRFYKGKIPRPGKLSSEDKKLLAKIKETQKAAGKHIENFNFLEGIKTVMELARAGNVYFNEKAPWKDEKTRNTTIFVSLNLVNSLSVLIAPFLPFTALEIKKQLGKKAILSDMRWADANEKIKAGDKISAQILPIIQKVEVNPSSSEKGYVKRS